MSQNTRFNLGRTEHLRGGCSSVWLWSVRGIAMHHEEPSDRFPEGRELLVRLSIGDYSSSWDWRVRVPGHQAFRGEAATMEEAMDAALELAEVPYDAPTGALTICPGQGGELTLF